MVIAEYLCRAQPRKTIRDAKSAHAPAPLRNRLVGLITFRRLIIPADLRTALR